MILVALFTICFIALIILGLIYGYRRYYAPPPPPPRNGSFIPPPSCESYTKENITCPSDTVDTDSYKYVSLKDCWTNIMGSSSTKYQLINDISNTYSKTFDKVYPESCGD